MFSYQISGQIIQCHYFQVYLDFGLAIPKLSVHGMISSIKELLELAPIKKVTTFSQQSFFQENIGVWCTEASKKDNCLQWKWALKIL